MPPTLVGQTLVNQYHIESFVALTPIGDLYRATDIRSNKSFAITHLPNTISDNVEALKEIDVEVNKLRGISNPYLVPYFGLHQTPTAAFLLEEWVDGPSLRDVLNNAPINVNESLVYAKAICSALETLHKQNYLHLNLSPELIHVNKRGEISISGIGTARRIGEKVTRKLSKYQRLYFSPEQFIAQPLSPAADIYALAVILYELTTGAWINGKSAPKSSEAIRKTHLDITPSTPISLNKEIPDHFSRMLLWALRKKPTDRLKTTTELLSSLALAAHISVDAVPLRTDPKTAPVTSAILNEWQFLPPPKQNILTQDLPSLEDRLAAVTTIQPKKNRARIGIVPIFIFAMMAGLISLFWFVRPAPIPIATPIQFTAFASDYTPPPTITPLPRPTLEYGGRIAFTCTRGDFNQLCMVNRDGTNYSQLTDMAASNYYPVFTPDGTSLLFSSNRNGAFDLYLLLFGQKELFQITQNVGNVISPDYSPDGRRIVFANRVSDGPTSIWMVNADGLNPHLVYTGPNTIVGASWSPDGEKIAYAMSVGIPLEYEIFTMDTNGKNHVRLSEGLQGIGGSIDWSPDSKYLLIYAGPFEDKDIFRLDASTGDATQLTDGGNNAGAVYSPDGQYIVFNSLRNDDQADLYIMRADGENQVQLTNNPEPDWGPQWVQ
ncbi:MAG: serine/threonine-protein kinase [Anaerolineales bacterium]|nr:serine/threonine-protein kinase [Anaerolineales bacterium]